MLKQTEQELLLRAARYSINKGLASSDIPPFRQSIKEELPAEFEAQRASFVTLKINNQLRGCIGNLEANSSLIDSVTHNAHAAAFSDPRFPPLNADEFKQIHISISMLTPSEAIEFTDETDLLKQLRPKVDGLIIERGNKHATFLPAVWENLPAADDFLRQLKTKAGIRANESIEKAWRYESESCSE